MCFRQNSSAVDALACGHACSDPHHLSQLREAKHRSKSGILELYLNRRKERSNESLQ